VTTTESNQMNVPGVVATLSNSTVSAQAVADGAGQFEVAHLPAGTYQFCWSARGFGSGCSPQQVVVFDDIVVLPAQELFTPTNGLSSGFVFGDVSLLDGSAPVFATD